MAEMLLPYPEIVREALRKVPAEVLRRVAAEGLPGDHHFFIELRTTADGVQMPPWLRAQYPESIRIVLQHDFRDLQVDEDGFSVNLSFGGTRTDLYVPFAAVTVFIDPSVEFALQFPHETTAPAPVAEPKPVAPPEEPEPSAVKETKGNVVSVDFSRKP